jgi:sterol desaturase/sphingolipid hydroxylase (fatty acid hydroxylase superfamily)
MQSFILDFLTRYSQQLAIYLIPTTLVYIAFYVILKKKLQRRYIAKSFPKNDKITHEIIWSAISRVIFTFIIILITYSNAHGYAKIYININQYGVWYVFVSALIMILWHDTYFYWLHRAIHSPKFFNLVHRTHHVSLNPTPFASNSFSPLESVAESLSIVIAIFVIPLNPAVILFVQFFEFAYNIYGHLGFEIMPSGFTKHWFFRWFNTATHHNMHHSKFKANYGLYFNFWDTWMNTNHRDYHTTFEAIHQRTANYSIEKL